MRMASAPMIETLEVTLGEYCWLERRRSGQTAEWWAQHQLMSVDELRERETDQRPVRLSYQQLTNAANMTLSVGDDTSQARKRSGERMTDVAAQMGVSRMTVWKMEHGMTASSTQLAQWWRRRGMPLPRLGAETLRMALMPGIYV